MRQFTDWFSLPKEECALCVLKTPSGCVQLLRKKKKRSVAAIPVPLGNRKTFHYLRGLLEHEKIETRKEIPCKFY